MKKWGLNRQIITEREFRVGTRPEFNSVKRVPRGWIKYSEGVIIVLRQKCNV